MSRFEEIKYLTTAGAAKELTPSRGKGYHGSMDNENNGEKPPIPGEKSASEQKNTDAPSDAQEKQRVNDKERDKVKEQAERESAAKAQRPPEKKNRKDKEEDEEKEEKGGGIFGAFLNFLKELFTDVEGVELQRKVEESETLLGLQAYYRIRPVNEWNAKDYARVLFMFEPDSSEDAEVIRKGLWGDIKKKRIEREVSIERTSIAQMYPELLPKKGESLKTEEKIDRNIASRAFEMNSELWRELYVGEGLSERTYEELIGFNKDWEYFLTRIDNSRHDMGKAARDSINQAKELRKKHPSGSFGKNDGKSAQVDNLNGSQNDGKGGDGGGRDVGFGNENEGKIDEIAKSTAETAKNTGYIVQELQRVNDKLDEIKQVLLKNLTNVEAVELYAKEYATYHRQKIALEMRLGEQRGDKPEVYWELWDKELYEGNVGEALGERMKRIEYFAKRSLSPDDPSLDPEAADISFEEKDFRERMEKLYKKYDEEGIVSKKEGEYFRELKRWVGNIIENSQYGTNPEHAHKLKLPADIYEEFKKIREMSEYANDYGDLTDKETVKKFEEELAGAVNKLKGMRFLDYFRGASYINYAGRRDSYGYPTSLEETARMIANNWRDDGWGTGEEYELVDAEGRFHMENFQLWMRKRMWMESDMDPLNPINLFQLINFKAGYSQLTLYDVLYVPQYTQHQDFEIAGDVSSWYGEEEMSIEPLRVGWGEAKVHPDFDWNKRVDMIIEAWRTGFKQSDWAKFNDMAGKIDLGEWVKLQYSTHNQNNYVRDGLLWQDYKLASHKEGETEKYFAESKQGSLGKAVRDGLLFYRHLTELSEFYTKKDEHGKTVGVRGLEDNMAYKVLDYDGSSVLLQSIAESSLNYADKKVKPKIMTAYKEFMLKRMGEIQKKYIEEAKSEEAKTKIRQLVKLYEGKAGGKISFDSAGELVDLRLKLETEVLGKRLVSQADKNKYNLDDKKAVTKEEVQRIVKKEVRKNLMKEFFEKVLEIEVLKVEENVKGEKKRIGRVGGDRVAIGDIEIYLTEDGRVVTEEEAKKIGRYREVSIRDIVKEFGEDFASEVDLMSYEEACKSGDEDTKEKYKRMFERNERLAMALLTKVANVPRKRLNIFNIETPPMEAADIMKEALKKSLAATYGLNEIEEKYAFQLVWYVLPQMMITSYNNTSGVPLIDQGTTLARFMEIRNMALGLGTSGGSKETMDELIALCPPTMLDAIPVKRSGEGVARNTLLGVLQGNKSGEGARDIKPRWERDLENDNQTYLIDRDAQRFNFIYNLQNGAKLQELIVKEQHMSFADVVKPDMWGVMKVDHAKAREVIDKWWNTLRQIYNKNSIDFDQEIAVDGRRVKVREHMLGKHTRKTLDLMRESYKELAEKHERVGERGKAAAYKAAAERIDQQPAIAALMNLVTTEIHEHRSFNSTYERWSVQNVAEMWWLMDTYLRDPGKIDWGGNVPEIKELPSLVPYGVFNKLLGVHKDSMEDYIFMDLFLALAGGLLEGTAAGIGELGDEVVQVKKTYFS